jgi:hypothetical protein
VLFGLTCFVVIEKQGKQEMLSHYRIIMDVDLQNALQKGPQNTHNIDFLAKQFNAAMKNYYALSNVEHEQL